MKKFFAVLLALLIMTCPVCAYADGEESDDGYLSFGELDGYELIYIQCPHGSESVTYVVGDYSFIADESFYELGVLKDGGYTSLKDAYGSVINDDMLSGLVGLFNSGKAGTELEAWSAYKLTDNAEIDVSGLDGTESVPSETESDTVGETEPDETHTETCTDPSPYEPTGTETESYSPGPWVTPTQPFTLRPTEPTESYIAPTKPIHSNTDPVTTEKADSIKDDNISYSSKLNIKSATVKCGRVIKLAVSNTGGKKVTFASAKPDVAAVGKTSGRVCALRRGSTYVVAKVGNKKLKFTIRVITDPKLSKTSLKVGKGKTVKVKTVGKCPLIKNKYGKSKYAKILSKTTAETLKIKGIKKGKTTLKLRVNGVLMKIKVKVV